MKSVLFGLLALLLTFTLLKAQDATPPDFQLYITCIERGIYPGRAVADVGYSYSGDTPITAEDSRFFGDTQTGQTEVFDFRIQPGDHPADARINVGAEKVVTWKVILFGQLHVITAWDDPEIPDCPFAITPDLTPEATDPTSHLKRRTRPYQHKDKHERNHL